MATFAEILADREAYPDDRKITMPGPNGQMVEMTMADVRNQAIGKGDYTKESQKWAKEKTDLTQAYQQQLGQFGSQLQALNAELERRGQPKVRTADELDDLAQDANDPVLGRYVKNMQKMSDALKETREQNQQLAKKLQEHEQSFWLNQHAQVIARIQGRDEDFKQPEKVKDLITYAHQNGLANLDLAHALMTRDRDIERAKTQTKTEAEKQAAEQAKVNAGTPHIPGGERAAPSAPTTGWSPPADSKDPFEAALQAAESDPSLEAIGSKFSSDFAGR